MVAEEHPCHLAADPDHLVAVVRVEDRVRVGAQVVEDREVVAVKAPTPPDLAVLYSGRQPSKRLIACESAAHHMSGKPGSTSVVDG